MSNYSPEEQAENAAIRFEREENHRWTKLHSIVYRNTAFFLGMSYTLIWVGIIALVVVVVIGGGAAPEFAIACVATSNAGVLMLLFTMLRPECTSWLRTVGRIVLVLALFCTIAIPTLLLLDWLLRQI